LARVSTVLNEAACRWLYRSIELDFSFVEMPWTGLIWGVLGRKRPAYRQYVQEITVVIQNKRYGATSDYLSLLSDRLIRLVASLPKLRKFWYDPAPSFVRSRLIFRSWNSLDNIPQSLVQSLESHSTLEHMHVDISHFGQENCLLPKNLYSQPKLTSIRANVSYRDDGKEDYSILHDLKKLLASSTHLKHLDIAFGLDGRGVSIEHSRISDFSPHERLENLETLILTNWSFELTDPARFQNAINPTKLQKLTLQNSCINLGNLFRCFQMFPLNLKVLEIFGAGMSPAFVSDYLVPFLTSFRGLEELRIQGYHGDLDQICGSIGHHRSTLRVLKLHTIEASMYAFQPISEETLDSLTKTCLSIEELWLDVDRQQLSSVCSPPQTDAPLAYADAVDRARELSDC
jgi:hypothetical protein